MRVNDPLRVNIAHRSGGRCEYCHYPEHFSPSSFEVEHIIPDLLVGLQKPITWHLLVHIVMPTKLPAKQDMTQLQKQMFDCLILE